MAIKYLNANGGDATAQVEGKDPNTVLGPGFEWKEVSPGVYKATKIEVKPAADIYGEQQKLMGEQQKAIGEQVRIAEEGIGLAQKAGEAGLLSARRTAAQQLASYRGLGEGGRGMSLGRGAAAEAGITQANIAAKTAAAVQEEKDKAAQARADAALAKQSFLDKQVQYNQEATDAQNDIQSIITRYKGMVYTDDSDRAKMKAEAQAAMNRAVSPQAKKAYADFIASIDNKTLDTPGAFDTY